MEELGPPYRKADDPVQFDVLFDEFDDGPFADVVHMMEGMERVVHSLGKVVLQHAHKHFVLQSVVLNVHYAETYINAYNLHKDVTAVWSELRSERYFMMTT